MTPPATTGDGTVPPPVTVAQVHVSVAGLQANVSYAGVTPGFPGVYQVNAQIPAGTPPGDQMLQISAAGATSNSVTISIR